jgi:uncharacterized RDD family membrane protein YckC
MTYGTPPAGNADPPEGYGQPPAGYAGPPPPPPSSWGQPTRYQPASGYGQPPAAYGQPPAAYGQPAGSPGGPPLGYANPAWNYSNWGMRFFAWLIDAAPGFVLYFIGGVLAGATHSFVVIGLFYLAAIAVAVYNRWYQAGKTGQSWGKKLLNMKLISEKTGQPIGGGMAFARDICHFLDCLCCFIGFLFPIWDDKRQTFADKVVGTVVIPSK